MTDLNANELYYQTPLPAFSWYSVEEILRYLAKGDKDGFSDLLTNIKVRATRPGMLSCNYNETGIALSTCIPDLNTQDMLWLVNLLATADALGRVTIHMDSPHYDPSDIATADRLASACMRWISHPDDVSATLQLATNARFYFPMNEEERDYIADKIREDPVVLLACSGSEKLNLADLVPTDIQIEEDRAILRYASIDGPMIFSIHEIMIHAHSRCFSE